MKIYDLIIIGAGPAGIMAASSLINSGMSILLIEKGLDLNKRRDLIAGWFGQALFSINLINFEDSLLDNNEAICEVMNLFNKVCPKYKILKNNKTYKMPSGFGKDLASYMFNSILKKIDIVFNSEVKKLEVNNELFFVETNKKKYVCKKCIISTGRNSVWFENICDSLNLQKVENRVKIGVRLETPTFKINKIIEENGKIDLKTKLVKIEDIKIDSFVGEWEDCNIVSAFGYVIGKKESNKTNFMVNFDSEKSLSETLKDIRIINILANDRIRKEKIIDFIEGRSILKYMKSFDKLKEVFVNLESIIPLFSNYTTMYVPEIKLNGIIVVDDNMRTVIPKLYAIGKCTNRVGNIIDSMVSGLIVAKTIIGEM